MTETVEIALQAALVVMVVLILPAGWRFLKGPSAADRMLAIDMITTLIVGSIVILAYLMEISFLIDVALALAAVSFIATLGVARYISEERVF